MPPQTPYESGPSPSNLPAGYEFINSPAPTRAPRGPKTPIMRIALVLGGLFVLLIVFTIIKGLFSGGSNKPQLLSVLQDQQALIHLSTAAQEEESLSTTTKHFTITTQLSVSSDQSKLLKYTAKNKIKVNPKLINLKVSPAIDSQLAAAKVASNYDRTFTSIMQTKLQAYQADINQAYAKTSGSNGRALLKSEYQAAALLLVQLNSPAS